MNRSNVESSLFLRGSTFPGKVKGTLSCHIILHQALAAEEVPIHEVSEGTNCHCTDKRAKTLLSHTEKSPNQYSTCCDCISIQHAAGKVTPNAGKFRLRHRWCRWRWRIRAHDTEKKFLQLIEYVQPYELLLRQYVCNWSIVM